MDFISLIHEVIERLSGLDRQRVAFGASSHDYEFDPPLTNEEVKSFERRHGVCLPQDYRRYVLELGNGGPGPCYGVLPLDVEEVFAIPPAGSPFPYESKFQFADEAPDEVIAAPIPGVVPVGLYGCGVEFLLVVCGSAAGQIWKDARYESGIYPVAASFADWWLTDMNQTLHRFEGIYSLMQSRTPHEEIHRLLEPGILQLDVDTTMLSIMDVPLQWEPAVYADKPWGRQCGLVEDFYGEWLKGRREWN